MIKITKQEGWRWRGGGGGGAAKIWKILADLTTASGVVLRNSIALLCIKVEMTPQWPEVEMDDYQFAFDEILQGVAAMALNNKTQSTGTVCSSSLS